MDADMSNMSNMNSSTKVQQEAYKRQQAERLQRSRDLRSRLLAKLQADPDGIWQELLAAIDEKDAK